MTRHVFLSFLGTGQYIPCNYHLAPDPPVQAVSYIQTALSLTACKDFGEKDRAFIFLTEQAKQANWHGLQTELAARNPGFPVNTVSIPEGHSENEIWNIFQTVFQQLQPHDRIILDITHAFRSIPMLGIVLLNYARCIHGITVDGIYYGAFETLGRAADARKLPENKRNVPVFNLSALHLLQQWSIGANDFLSSGDPRTMARLLREWAEPRCRESRGRDKTALHARKLAKRLEELYGQLTTVRGNAIREGTTFLRAHHHAESLKTEVPVPPLAPLLNRLSETLKPFQADHPENELRAARLCLEFGLIQQGITLLQEFMVTLLAHTTANLNPKKREHRERIAAALNITGKCLPEDQWHEKALQHRNEIRKLQQHPLTRTLGPLFTELSQLRNDINHAGHTGNARPADKFREVFQQHLEETEAIIATEPEHTGGSS